MKKGPTMHKEGAGIVSKHPDPRRGRVSGLPSGNVVVYFPMERPPTVLLTVGGRFSSIGTALTHQLVNESGSQTRKSAPQGRFYRQPEQAVTLICFRQYASFTPARILTDSFRRGGPVLSLAGRLIHIRASLKKQGEQPVEKGNRMSAVIL